MILNICVRVRLFLFFSFSDANRDASRLTRSARIRTAEPCQVHKVPRTFELARGVPENTCFFYSVGPLICLHRCSDVCLPDVSHYFMILVRYMLSRTTNIYSARLLCISHRVILRYTVERKE